MTHVCLFTCVLIYVCCVLCWSVDVRYWLATLNGQRILHKIQQKPKFTSLTIVCRYSDEKTTKEWSSMGKRQKKEDKNWIYRYHDMHEYAKRKSSDELPNQSSYHTLHKHTVYTPHSLAMRMRVRYSKSHEIDTSVSCVVSQLTTATTRPTMTMMMISRFSRWYYDVCSRPGGYDDWLSFEFSEPININSPHINTSTKRYTAFEQFRISNLYAFMYYLFRI